MGTQTRQQATSKKLMTGMEHRVGKPNHGTVSRATKLAQAEFLKDRPYPDSTIAVPAAKDARVKKQPN